MPSTTSRHDTGHDSVQENRRPTKKKRVVVESSDSEEEDTVVSCFAEFDRTYQEIMEVCFNVKTKATYDYFDSFVARVTALEKKTGLSLICCTVHVICNDYAASNNLEKAKWEKLEDMKEHYKNGTLPKYKAPSFSFKFTPEEEEKEEEELNAFTFLKAKMIDSHDIALLLQKKCVDRDFHGFASKKDPLFMVYENDVAFNMFLLDTLLEITQAQYPLNNSTGNESVGWIRDVFEAEDVLYDKIRRCTNMKGLCYKLNMRAGDDQGSLNWCKDARIEIAKKCGIEYKKRYPNVPRNAENRPIYTQRDVVKMKSVYQKVLQDLAI